MPNRNIIPILYALSIVSVAMAVFAKSAQASPVVLFMICLAMQLLFAFAAIAELRSSEKISNSQKSLWSSLLLFVPLVSGIFYLRSIRAKSEFSR